MNLLELLMGPKQVISLKVRVELGVLAMNGFSTLPRSRALNIRHSLVSYLGHPFLF